MWRAAPWLLLGGMAGAAAAQDVDCAQAEIQVELTYCAELEWLAADDELNVAYRSARETMRAVDAGLPEAERGAEAALKAAQIAWVTFRDNACAAEAYPAHGGSIAPMLIYLCRERLTRARTGDLRALAVNN